LIILLIHLGSLELSYLGFMCTSSLLERGIVILSTVYRTQFVPSPTSSSSFRGQRVTFNPSPISTTWYREFFELCVLYHKIKIWSLFYWI